MPDVTDTGSTATWAQIAQYNLGVAPLPEIFITYNQETIDRKIAAINAVSLPSGLNTGDIVTGSGAGMFARFPADGGSTPKFLKETGTTLSWDTISPTDVTTGLGYTPVNKTGDTMSGNLTMTGTAKITLAVEPTDGSADLDVASVFYVKSKVSGMGAGNVVSINTDTTAAQTLTKNNSTFPELTITDNLTGDHKFGWSGQLTAIRGGTGLGSFTVGDQLYANTNDC
jgi:hypothetical protein